MGVGAQGLRPTRDMELDYGLEDLPNGIDSMVIVSISPQTSATGEKRCDRFDVEAVEFILNGLAATLLT